MKVRTTLKNISAVIWEVFKTPLIIFIMFWFGGAGLYFGFSKALDIDNLIEGKALLITFIDLSKK